MSVLAFTGICSTGANAQATATDTAQPPADLTAPEASDDIVVTGIRGALVQGLQNKRQSDVIVESISAEDIGQFPDANIAEALQRVPGIAIDRDGGEGRFVTIRGFGPSFNTVLINGRRIATENANRSFSFDTISSDLVGGINVYKTQQPDIREGGIGGTIDVRTLRPLDRPGFHVSAQVEGLYEFNSKEATPQGSVVATKSFFDDTFGVLLSFTRQQRKNLTYTVDDGYGTQGFFRSLDAFTVVDPFTYSNFGVNPVYRPQALATHYTEETRTRTGFSGALQFKPSSNFEINVDGLYSDFDIDTTEYYGGTWQYAVDPPRSAAPAIAALGPQYAAEAARIASTSQTTLDGNGVVTRWSSAPGTGSRTFTQEERFRPTKTYIVGGNVKWKPSDTLTLTLDGSYSKATLTNKGDNRRRYFEAVNRAPFLVDFASGVPSITGGDGTLLASIDNWSNLRARNATNFGTDIRSINKEISGKFDWQPDPTFKLSGGFLYEQADKNTTDYATPADIISLYQNTDEQATVTSRAALESIVTGVLNSNPSNFGIAQGSLVDTFAYNLNAFDAYLASPAALAALGRDPRRATAIAAFIARGSNFNAVDQGTGYRITEKVTSAYFNFSKKGEVFDTPFTLTAGLRYSHTDVTGVGFSQVLTNLIPNPQPNNPFGLLPVFAAPDGPNGLTRLSNNSSYDNWLPSANLKIDLTDRLVLRLAGSQTLTRPDLDDLAPPFLLRSSDYDNAHGKFE